MKNFVPSAIVEKRILFIRGQKVMLDRDLAELYGVETKYLNRQVKNNLTRFPKEFMFQLSKKEKVELVTNLHQFKSLKHSYQLPFAFTEHGITMLASVLNSKRAIAMSILVVKTFVRLREMISSHKVLEKQIHLLESKIDKHDHTIQSIIEVIKTLMNPPPKPRMRIGFRKDRLHV